MKKTNNNISDWLDKYGNPEVDKQVEKKMKATEQGNQYCNYCQKETWHTPKLGLVFDNKRLCEECHASNKIEDIK